MKIEYHPLTVDDPYTAEIHYKEKQSGLSQDFKTEFIKSIERIRENPFLYTQANGVRRALLKRFPLSIVYRILRNNTIRIPLIRHHQRHPAFGSERQ